MLTVQLIAHSASAGACAVSAMSPIMVMSSLAGFDNQNGWERYRATLPLTRKDIICARYLCIVVFSAIMACAAVLLNIIALPFFNSAGVASTGQTIFEIAIASAASMLISLMMVFLAQPLFFRFGHMEALRLSVGLFALLGCLTMAALSSSNPISNWLMSIAGANPDPAVLGCLCAGIAVLALMPESPSDALARVSTTKMNRPTPAMLGVSVRTMASSDIKARFILKPLSA